MADLLHIEASPRKSRSASIEVANAFVGAYRETYPEATVASLDLWGVRLPEFDGDALEAKYAGLSGIPLTSAQRWAWDRVGELAQPLIDAKTLLISMPLWNFSVPYKLKHFIDVVSHKDVLFRFDPERGFEGMLQGRRAVVVYARGLDYGKRSATPAEQLDFQQPFFEAWLKFVGITDIESVIVEKTLYGDEVDRSARDEACGRAVALARGRVEV